MRSFAYSRAARPGLEVFLTDPDVPIDTNHLERALRVIPMGKKNWMFAWTELGAKHIGMFNSLIVTSVHVNIVVASFMELVDPYSVRRPAS